MNRRLLVTAAVGVALVISAVLVASMKGDDKPTITTNPPPPEDEEPQDTQVNPTPETETLPPSSDDDQNEDQDEEPQLPDDDEDGPADDDEEDPEGKGKARGLQNAIDAHKRNLEKAELKNKTAPPGLLKSLELLTEKYEDVLSGEKASSGKAKGHDKGT